jgi:hypothetical protein
VREATRAAVMTYRSMALRTRAAASGSSYLSSWLLWVIVSLRSKHGTSGLGLRRHPPFVTM